MRKEIDVEKAARIWKAQDELIEAICDAQKEGLVVDILTERLVSGTQIPVILIKQVVTR